MEPDTSIQQRGFNPMKRSPFIVSMLAIIAALSLTGCSRTIDDIAKWKTKGDVVKLIKALEDPKVEVRLAATEALGELQAEPAVDAIAALYIDPEEVVVLASVEALAAIGSDSTVTPLIAALKLGHPQPRETAAVKLGELGAVGAVGPLGEALDDDEAAIQLAAATSLGQIGDEGGSAALVGKLGDASDELRLICVQSLGATGGETAADGLIGALGDADEGVREAAVKSLVTLGAVSEPRALEALKDERKNVRVGALATLRGLKKVPDGGADLIWYQLARVSVDTDDEIDKGVVQTLFKQGEPAIDTLLEAAAHPVPDFREHAILALERVGQPAAEKAVAAAKANAGPAAKKWFEGRGEWSGAPSWMLNLWGATAALNPDFKLDEAQATSLEMQARPAFNVIVAADFEPTRAYIPLLIQLMGDTAAPPPEEPDYDAEGVPIIKKKRDMFRGEANQMMAKDKLAASGYPSTFPLIAAIEAENELIAGHAASILGERDEKRALRPLIKVVRKKLEAGEHLTSSPFYVALQRMDDPAAEPLLQKVRPDPDRAMRLFERQYGIHPISSETEDSLGASVEPVTFRLGFINSGKVGELFITFARDGVGNWKPTPPLPEALR